jgi:ERCC4-type nuclease
MPFPYVVIRDTREKENQGWSWSKSKYCAGTETRTLDTGDYSLEGMENYLAIERKGSISEWAKNVTEARFERELERLDGIQHPWILLEFNMTDVLNYPVGSGIPKNKWRWLKFRGPFILKKMTEMMRDHRVNIVLCGANGKEVASNIFKRVIEHADSNATKSKQQASSS